MEIFFFLDTDGDGRPDEDEAGVSGARILLAGGRSVITDPQGRYHFGNVPFGTHALRLDPQSLKQSGSTNDFTRLTRVSGLTTEHFALEPSLSAIGRAQTYNSDVLRTEQTVWPARDSYYNEIKLTNTSNAPLTVALQPYLPKGSTTQQIEPVRVTLDAGQSANYSYEINYDGPIKDLLVAPQMEVSQ